ncbi:MAG: CusA/CzcA family heavy metal efflux RND transporter [Burkholderiales bacterium]
MEKLITFALQQRVFVIAASLVIAIAGVQAWQKLPVEAFPDVQDVQVLVVTQVPGQAPQEVERAVTLPIEREMSGLPRLTQIRSVSITGLSVVTLTFAERTQDYFARQQVMEKLQTVDLPPGVQPTLGPLTNAVGEVFRYVVEAPPEMDSNEVRAIQDWVIRPAIRRVPDVADVVSFGGSVKEYQLRVDPFALRKHQITIDQVADALGKNSANAGGGILTRGDEAMVVRGIGIFRNLEDLAQVVVATREGRPIVAGDLGEVIVGSRPRSGVVMFNEKDNVVQGIVQMVKGRNAVEVVAGVKAAIERVSHQLPKGVTIRPYYDRTELVSHTVHTVTHNLALGAVLVVGILLIFLRRWQAALAVAVVIPLSLLFAFILMDALGVSANLISLGAVDFGIIIDSAVVLVEAVMVRLTVGALDGTARHQTYAWRMHTLRTTALAMGKPIIFSKAIIILAFLPIFTFQRVEGKIFSPMAYTLTFALLGAILLTLTLVPALISYAIKTSDLTEKHSALMEAATARYLALIEWAQKRWRLVVIVSVLMVVISVLLAPRLGSEFLPKLDEGNIWLTITLPPATGIDKSEELARFVRTELKAYPEVNNVVVQVGRPDDGTDPKGLNNIEILADMKPRDTWRFPDKEALIADMTTKLKVIPGLPTNFSQVIQDNVEEALSGVKGEISVKIFGPDLDLLEDKSEQVANVLRSIRGSSDVAALKVGGQTEVDIVVDRPRLARYGMTVDDVAQTIRTALAGTAVNVFYEGDRRFDVTLRLDRQFRDSIDDIPALPVALPNGGTIPLDAIANVEVRQGAARISREQGGRNVAIKANLLGRDQGSFVEEAMEKVKSRVKLPPGYTMTWGGQFENQQRALERLKIIVPLSILGIFVLLFWAFGSMMKALLILLMVPFTLIGGLAGLAFADLHLSISAAVGFIAVAGISVQNGVIMVEQFVEIIDVEGKSLAEAVMEGAQLRFRPIVMTALMAGLGLLPAALSHGIGSETQRPFAVVIVGGMVSATLFTLLLLPVLYPFFCKEAEGFQGQDKATPAVS